MRQYTTSKPKEGSPMKPSRILAYCSTGTALGVILLLLGYAIGVGTYCAPLFVGLCLDVIGRECGLRYQALVWVAISLLSFMLCPDLEQNLMFFCFFGWYPMARPKLQSLPRPLRLPAKLLVFNAIILAVEALVLVFFLPEDLSLGLILSVMILFNLVFLVYDYVVPRFYVLEDRFFRRIFPNGRKGPL